MALSQQFRQACASGWMLDFTSIVALPAAIGLLVSLGFYISLSTRSGLRNATGQRRSTPLKRLLGVFAVTALSAGTLTWASAAPPQQCTIQGRLPQASSSIIPGPARLDGQAGAH
jgi:hypothetical protein